ncbi:hypothetical protein [Ramlibacter albus]|uniref:Uncharacterized protein n=1 Tax=Ramlibacter albus TaxID=2079448 RepID=A0A923MBQ7_9BURK|nr:hypothetical protein [Ramlibacter albus]MBC5767266.1 hypothetical protein [Ramlibacter albus]
MTDEVAYADTEVQALQQQCRALVASVMAVRAAARAGQYDEGACAYREAVARGTCIRVALAGRGTWSREGHIAFVTALVLQLATEGMLSYFHPA